MTYERIVREFSAQTAAVEQARERLALLSDGAPPSGTVSHRLISTLEAGGEIVSVSRDGRFVAYLTDDGLTINDVRTGTMRTITAGKDQLFEDAAVSRNGARVAITLYNVAEDRDELHVADASTNYALQQVWVGEAYSQMSDRPKMAVPQDWTPDGSRVLVVLTSLGSATLGEFHVALLTVEGRTLRVLRPNVGLLGRAVLSPDGTQVAYETLGPSGSKDISICAIDGGGDQPVVVHRASDRLSGWAPEGNAIVFSSRRTDGDGLWRVPVIPGRPTGAPEFLLSHGQDLRSFGVTSDGAVHYGPVRDVGGRQVKVGGFDFGAGQWRTQPSDALNEVAVGATEHPGWSPDGKEVAYIALSAPHDRRRLHLAFQTADNELWSGRVALPLTLVRWLRWTKDGRAVLVYGYSGGSLSLLKVDRSSTEVATVAVGANNAADAFGGWSNDGKRVYLQRQLPDGGIVLIEREWAGGEERELFRAADRAGYPVLSPDGTKLYYSRTLSNSSWRSSSSVAIERDLATGLERELSAHRNLGGMNLSPDGRYIATASNDPAAKTRSFILIRTDGGGTKTLMTIPVTAEWLAAGDSGPSNPLGLYVWAPDSSAMILRNDLARELWWVPIDERGPRAVATAGMGDVLWAGNWAIHPDGSRIAFHSRTTTAPKPPELWVIENLLRKGK